MTEQQKQAIKDNPIYWTASGCEELCTQVREQLTTDAYTRARAEQALGHDAGEDVVRGHEDAKQEIQALGEDAGSYLLWSYMALPAIERAVDAGAWDAGAATDFFTR